MLRRTRRLFLIGSDSALERLLERVLLLFPEDGFDWQLVLIFGSSSCQAFVLSYQVPSNIRGKAERGSLSKHDFPRPQMFITCCRGVSS